MPLPDGSSGWRPACAACPGTRCRRRRAREPRSGARDAQVAGALMPLLMALMLQIANLREPLGIRRSPCCDPSTHRRRERAPSCRKSEQDAVDRVRQELVGVRKMMTIDTTGRLALWGTRVSAGTARRIGPIARVSGRGEYGFDASLRYPRFAIACARVVDIPRRFLPHLQTLIG